LPQRLRHVGGLHGRNARQHRFGALQADAAERDLQALGRLAVADASIGLLDETQRQHGAVLNKLGDLPHRLAAVAQRQSHLAMDAGKRGKGCIVESLDPGGYRAWQRRCGGHGRTSFSSGWPLVWRKSSDNQNNSSNIPFARSSGGDSGRLFALDPDGS